MSQLDAATPTVVLDLRGARTHDQPAPVLADPSGRRAMRLRRGGRAAGALLMLWMCGLGLTSIGVLPARLVPLAGIVLPALHLAPGEPVGPQPEQRPARRDTAAAAAANFIGPLPVVRTAPAPSVPATRELSDERPDRRGGSGSDRIAARPGQPGVGTTAPAAPGSDASTSAPAGPTSDSSGAGPVGPAISGAGPQPTTTSGGGSTGGSAVASGGSSGNTPGATGAQGAAGASNGASNSGNTPGAGGAAGNSGNTPGAAASNGGSSAGSAGASNGGGANGSGNAGGAPSTSKPAQGGGNAKNRSGAGAAEQPHGQGATPNG